MTFKERDITFELGDWYIIKRGTGHYELCQYAPSYTHGVVKGAFHFSNDPEKALALAIRTCKERQKS